jgi:outer membrane protein
MFSHNIESLRKRCGIRNCYFPARVFLFIFSIVVLTPVGAVADDLIQPGQLLGLGQCVGIALKRNPTLTAAVGTVDVNQSRVGQAKANYYPQLNWSSGYDRIAPLSGSSRSSSASSGIFASDGAHVGSYNQYAGGINLNQMLLDFGKTRTQVTIQDFTLDSSRSDLENLLDGIVFSVKQSYFGLLAVGKARDVAQETVAQYQQHLEQAKGFYEVGTKPKFDVTNAEVDVSNATLNLIKAENALKIARANLNNAMGIPDAPDYTIEDNFSFVQQELSFEESLAMAYRSRYDLKSVMAQKKSAEASIELAKKGYFPLVTGSATYDWLGANFPLEHGWNAGVSLSFPLFSGFLTKHQVEESRAQVTVVQGNEDSLRQSIFLEVKQAYLNLKEAEERVPTAQVTVKQAEENFAIATGRYAAGLGSPIEITDASVRLSSAKLGYIQAIFDDKVAQASLEKAMGTR